MMEHSPKVVVFDLGGVILDWRAGLHTVAKLVNRNGDEIHNFLQEYLAPLELGEMLEDDFWKLVATKFGYTGPVHELAKAWTDGQSRIEPTISFLPEVAAKYKMVACTNNWLGVVENQEKNIPEFKYFETIIDSSQEKVKKPDPKIYRLVESRVYASGQDVLLIDDSNRNCEQALFEGWQVYLFDMKDDRGQSAVNELRKILL
jgi:2-haloacid dehalogenase